MEIWLIETLIINKWSSLILSKGGSTRTMATDNWCPFNKEQQWCNHDIGKTGRKLWPTDSCLHLRMATYCLFKGHMRTKDSMTTTGSDDNYLMTCLHMRIAPIEFSHLTALLMAMECFSLLMAMLGNESLTALINDNDGRLYCSSRCYDCIGVLVSFI